MLFADDSAPKRKPICEDIHMDVWCTFLFDHKDCCNFCCWGKHFTKGDWNTDQKECKCGEKSPNDEDII